MMTQYNDWGNTKLIVDAHHNESQHSTQPALEQAKANRSGVALHKRALSLLVIATLLMVVNTARAQSHFDAAPHLQRLQAALAAGDFLRAYGEFFQINDSAPAVVKSIYEARAETDADKQTLAFFLALTGRAEAALAVLDALPDGAFSCTLRAAANEFLGNTKAADNALEQAVELAEDDAQVYGFIANAAFVSFNVESMMTNSSRALEIEPDLALALRIRSLAYLFSGDPQAALVDADYGIELDPSFYGFHTLRANIHLALGEPDAALTELDAALAINPDSYVAHAMRSGVNMALGNLAAAGQDFAASVSTKTVEIIEEDALLAGSAVPLAMTLGRTFHLPFDAQMGQEVTLSVAGVNPGEVDPTVLLLSPQGVPLVFNDDASDETLDAAINAYSLSESGTYTVVVSHANGGSEGEITVLLALASAPPSGS